MKSRPLPGARFAGLRTGTGLTVADVAARAARYGPNDVAVLPGATWRATLRDAAGDLMIWFLVGTATLYALVGQLGEAATLLAALVPLVAMDVVLHRRTHASVAGLAGRLATHATVLRDGRRVDVAAVSVVPGDLAFVNAGQSFPADGVLESAADLQVDESALTGEAYPVGKRTIATLPSEGEPPIDHDVWVFAGTRALTGRAALRVAFTGGETLYGALARAAGGTGTGRTPLQRAIDRLVTVLVVAAVVLCGVVAAARLAQGFGWVDAIVSAVTLASAALPEEFPVVFAFYLGAGVFRLARCEALVRRAVSVENIGRVTCICTDKTGTLTEGRLRLTALVPSTGLSEDDLVALAATASRADSGDPLDAVILAAANARGLKPAAPALATFPFTESRKRETAITLRDDGVTVAVTKGAPEVVLALCALDDTARARWRTAIRSAAEARKVVACAWRPLDDADVRSEPTGGFRLAGLLALEDPVRAGVAAAVAGCRRAGIRILMVTGDHPVTATAVARAVGLGGGTPRVVVGDALEDALARGDARALRDVDVVARATPAQKLALVETLQEDGEVVAVTGDGVNDVPALRAADVGIAMGERGTESAREVADVVLLNDDFGTIERAVGEGRRLFRDLRLSFAYLLIVHIPLVLAAALIPLAGFPLLYLPIHIVWLELIIHPTALLVFQNVAPVVAPAPAGGRARFFSRRQWTGIVLAGFVIFVGVAGGYFRATGEIGDVEHARAVALAVLTAAGAAVTAALSGLATRRAWLVTGVALVASVVAIQVPALAAMLHLVPLHVHDWVTVAVVAVVAGTIARLARARAA